MFSKEVLKIVRRLQGARLSLMIKQPFYAVLLLHMQFSLDPMCETVYTDGERIAFCPDFIGTLSDSELEFVLMHEVLHAALNHCNRNLDSYDFDDFNTACDIVVNSNILHSFGMDVSRITLKNYGESMHLAPDGKEGYMYTAEEVYLLVAANSEKKRNEQRKKKPSKYVEDDETSEKEKSDQSGKTDEKPGGDGATDGDEGVSARTDGGFDDHTYWGSEDDDDSSSGQGESGSGDGEDDDEPQDGDSSSGQGEADSGAGEDDDEPQDGGNGGTDASDQGQCNSYHKGDEGASGGYSEEEMRDMWHQRLIEATQIAEQISEHISVRRGSKGRGTIPLGAQRIVKELTEPQTDWREVLDTFIQEEITDYSFNPPDRRFQDSPFLLPDYNEKDESVKDLLFMIDTSGSMSDKMITQAYSEIYGAIQQFNGRLQGWLGFFDASVVKPEEFTDEDEFKIIRPGGGGGTSFHCIFQYVREHLDEINPASIIILTDGYAPWPKEKDALDIPVLWIINNEDVTPPWGKIARIKVKE